MIGILFAQIITYKRMKDRSSWSEEADNDFFRKT
jgi:hypothetical protein